MMKQLLITLLAATTTVAAWCGEWELRDFVLADARPNGMSAMVPAADGKSFFRLAEDDSNVERVDYRTGKRIEMLISDSALKSWGDFSIDGYALSDDEQKLLFWTDSKPIYRHSFRAKYFLCDRTNDQISNFTLIGGEEIATISPDGQHVAYVKDNNICLYSISDGTFRDLTDDGKPNEIIYGVPDWVYQEEFSLLSSLCWSDDGQTLAFMRWDERHVPMCQMALYAGDCEPKTDYPAYPSEYRYKYPVAGERNAVVSVYAYSVASGTTTPIALPLRSDDYVPFLSFAPNGQLMVTTLNRAQDNLCIYACDAATGATRPVYNERSDTWIETWLLRMVRYYDDCMVIASDRSDRPRLYLHSYDGTLMRQLTPDIDESITAFYGYDPKSRTVYYQRTAGPLERVVARADEQGNEQLLSPPHGTSSAIAFSKNFSYFIQNYNDALTPPQYRVADGQNGKTIRDIELNADYAARYTAPDVPKREFFTFTTDNDGISLNGYMVKPVDFDPSKQYPVIMSQYSGPGSQEVLNSWQLDWEEYFAMQGFVVVCVDGRGTGGRGKAFTSVVFRQMGHYETIDQLAAARYVAAQPWADPDAIGIWGWSYGGFEALLAMSQPDSRYAAGVAIAPVTDWRFYDTIYAERYMRTPQENEEGYSDNAPLELAHQLRGDLLLMFGSADDNVRIVNSMEYIARLHDMKRPFDMMVFPNMNHSINGCEVREPLYRRVLDFFTEKLKKR